MPRESASFWRPSASTRPVSPGSFTPATRCDLVTFTVGPKEARAWTVEQPAAPQAAGRIHTDFEKGFIRAETIAYPILSHTAASRAQKMLLDAPRRRHYVVQDGDIMHFRLISKAIIPRKEQQDAVGFVLRTTRLPSASPEGACRCFKYWLYGRVPMASSARLSWAAESRDRDRVRDASSRSRRAC